jgi:Spy/CpxP family protein refolding chaperone
VKKGVESLGRLRLQGLLLLGLAFVSGGLAGIAIEHTRSVSGERAATTRMPAQFGRRGVLPPQLDGFDLTSEQRAEIQAILERRQPETDSILRLVMPRLNAIMEATRAEIREVLTPEQQEGLDEMMPRRRGPRGPRARDRGFAPADTATQPGEGAARGGLPFYPGR